MKKLRIGIAGLGAVAQAVHLPLVRRRWDLFEIVAVADLSATLVDTVGDQYAVPAEGRFASLTAMLAGAELDGVLLLASGSHGGPALEAIRAGVPVFCEKPLALSLAEADELAAAERDAGRPMLLLAYMKEYDPAVVRARAALAEIGAPRWAEVEVLHPSGPSQLAYANLLPPARDVDPVVLGALRASDDRAVDAAVGADLPSDLRSAYQNLVLGSLIHDISLLRFLLGSLDTIDDARLWDEAPDTRSVDIGGWIAGVRTRLHWHYLPDYPAYTETVVVHGETGSVRLVFTVPYLLNAPTELTVVTRDGDATSENVYRDVSEAFERELVAYADMVNSGAVPPTGIAEGRADIVSGQAIARALAAAVGVEIGGEAGQ